LKKVDVVLDIKPDIFDNFQCGKCSTETYHKRVFFEELRLMHDVEVSWTKLR